MCLQAINVSCRVSVNIFKGERLMNVKYILVIYMGGHSHVSYFNSHKRYRLACKPQSQQWGDLFCCYSHGGLFDTCLESSREIDFVFRGISGGGRDSLSYCQKKLIMLNEINLGMQLRRRMWAGLKCFGKATTWLPDQPPHNCHAMQLGSMVPCMYQIQRCMLTLTLKHLFNKVQTSNTGTVCGSQESTQWQKGFAQEGRNT